MQRAADLLAFPDRLFHRFKLKAFSGGKSMLSARVLSVEEFFRLGVFAPARVQRDYVWDAAQSEDLLNDVERACADVYRTSDENSEVRISIADDDHEEDDGEPEASAPLSEARHDAPPVYHLGGVVLRRLGADRFEIFDGLQRATTLTILMCLIRDLTASPDLRERLQALIETGGGAARVSLPGADGTLQKEIQAAKQTLKNFRREVGARGKRIRRSRGVFYSLLKTWDQDRLSSFAKFLLERTLLVVAETAYADLAGQVFITANRRGLQLTPVDIFKGQLLEIAEGDGATEKIARAWDGLLQILGDEIEPFLQALDFIKRRAPQGPDHLTKFADFIEKTYGAGRILEAMDEMRNYASAWAELTVKLKQSSSPIENRGVWRLRFFKWFEWRPLALAWYKECRDLRNRTARGAGERAEKTFQKRFSALHRVCMVLTLAKFSAADRAKIFGKALSQWKAKGDPLSAKGARPGALTFSPHQIAKAAETLGTPLYDDEIRLMLMRWLEAGLSAEAVHPDVPFATVEHILPRRPEPGSQWLRDFPNEEERFAACHSIGNLAVMDYDANVEIANRDFGQKIAVIREQAEKYKTLADVAALDCWTASAVRARAAATIAEVWRLLNIPGPVPSASQTKEVELPFAL